MAKKLITIKPLISPFDLELDPANPEAMRDTIARARKVIDQHLNEMLVITVNYTSAGMLADMRKCHANGIGAPPTSEAALRARAELAKAGVAWEGAHLDDSRITSPAAKGGVKREAAFAKMREKKREEDAKAAAEAAVEAVPAEVRETIEVDVDAVIAAARDNTNKKAEKIIATHKRGK